MQSGTWVIPNEECVKQHCVVVNDFSAHISVLIKRKMLPRIGSWNLRDPATAIKFQLAFKVKTTTAAAAVATASGADADTTNRVESAWS